MASPAMPSAMAPLIPGATPSGAAPDSGPDSESPSQTVVTITDNGDGTYSVSCDDGDDDSDDSQPQTAKGVPAALKLAAGMLTGSASNAWNAAAAQRPPGQ
jgi:hypothetical protein